MIAPGTHEEISSSCKTNTNRNQQRSLRYKCNWRTVRKAIPWEIADTGFCQKMKASHLSGDELLCVERKAKTFQFPSAHFLSELTHSFPGPPQHHSIHFFCKLLNSASSPLHRGKQSKTTFKYPANSTSERLQLINRLNIIEKSH